jgi:hypothetical protein
MSRRIARVVLWLGGAVVLVAGVVVFGLILIATDPARDGQTAGGSPRPSASGPAWSGPLLSMGPGQIAMPEGADCGACHVLDGGGVGVRAIPPIAHPVHGWTECTSCHSNDSLVATAPGHTGVHADQCIVCHRDSSKPAPTPRHPSLPDADCLGCHGSIAPLPSTMVDRPRELCWLCHHS